MKRIVLLGVCGLTVLSGAAATPDVTTLKGKLTEMVHRLMPNHAKANKSADTNWRPQSIERYEAENGSWILKETESYVWYAPDKPLEVIIDKGAAAQNEKDVYSYNDNGYPMEKKEYIHLGTGATEWGQYGKQIWTYDEVMPSFVLEESEYNLNSNKEWVITEGYKNVITRNDQGNVTSQVQSECKDGVYETTFKTNIQYGSNKQANKIDLYSCYDENGTTVEEPEMSFKNITWIETDGQFLLGDDNESSFAFLTGNNRASKATVIMYDDENTPIEIAMTVTYSGSKMTANGTGSYQGIPVKVKFVYTELAYGGSKAEMEISMNMGFMSYKVTNTSTDEYNEWGMRTLHEETEGQDGEINVTEKEVYNVTFDSEGYPATGILSELDEDTNTLKETKKDVFFNYGPTSINEVMDQSSAAEYYTLQGVKVLKPAKGIYIKKQNGVTTKIMVE